LQTPIPNGSSFHCFGSKKELAGTLFLEVLQICHAAILAAIGLALGAQDGIGRLIHAHLDWVVNNRHEARYLFEISRGEWTEEVRDAQRTQNSRLADGIEGWRAPLIARGQPALTAEYKLNLLSPASGERLICRARVIKPGRQVAVVAADVFCVIDGIEKYTATALASIAMLAESVSARIPSPA
jgi:AcrR family transcriptional regulator